MVRLRLVLYFLALSDRFEIQHSHSYHIKYGLNYVINYRTCDRNFSLDDFSSIDMPKILKIAENEKSRVVLYPLTLFNRFQIQHSHSYHIKYGFNQVINYRRCDRNFSLGDFMSIDMSKILKIAENERSRLVLYSLTLSNRFQIQHSHSYHITYGLNYVINYRRCDKNFSLGDFRSF